ncbi:MAG TPA: DUF2844 domain-containing protein [Candidatus Dormibacteraeota bacterium]|nr:DUF2844 domain-containing protein [Candidatus Dormibacteraeota bacterium]
MSKTGIACALLALAMGSAAAFAGLGDDAASVQSDLARMKGTLRSNTTPLYTIHEISTAYGTIVREYVSPANKVFAVSWRGPQIPDLRQVLSGYYGQYDQAASTPRIARRHLVIDQPGLVMQSSGHTRAFFGRAWVPALLPAKFAVSEIH